MAQPERDLKVLQPSERAAEVDEVVNALMEQMERPESMHSRFLADYDLKKVIEMHRQPLFEFEEWDEAQVQFVIDNCTQVLATLILCSAYTQVQSIRDLFFTRAGVTPSAIILTDEQLWIEDERKLSDFLPTGLMRKNFMSMQYTIKPYRFKEEMPSETLRVPAHAHLPFKEEVHHVGVGGYGCISKVLVAYKYLVRANLSEYHEDEWCALKQIRASDAFLQEVRQLQILKETLTTHDKILQHYVSFTHGQTFNILLPLAKYGDLEIFLNEGLNLADPENASPVYDFQDTFPTFSLEESKCIEDLFSQFWGVADAVRWLHSKESKPYLIHMDLKPANILVMEDFAKSENRSSVGIWRLSDFGLSVEKSQRSDSSLSQSASNPSRGAERITIYDALKHGESNLTNSSRTVPQRREGTYQAPEVVLQGRRDAVGRCSDVWSLACILSEVVAFAVGGREKVKAFQEHRERRHSDDYFYSPVASKRSAASQAMPRFKRRSTVDEWLRELASGDGSATSLDWLKCGVEVVLTALVCNQDARPDAASFSRDVEHLRDHYKHRLSDQTEGSHCRILRRLSADRSQGEPNGGHISRQPTELDTDERDSSSTPSSRVVTETLPISRSNQSGQNSVGEVTESHPRLKCRTSSHTVPISEMSDIDESHQGAIYMSTCRGNNMVLTLYKSSFTIIDLSSPELPPKRYQLSPEIEWDRVWMMGRFAAVRGHEGKGKEGQKHVVLWSLDEPYNVQLRPSENPTLAKVSDIAVSHTGLIALQCDYRILLYNIGASSVAGQMQSDPEDLDNGSSNSIKCTELFSDEDYHFDKLEFSSSGQSLIAWGWGSKLKNAFFRWDLDVSPVRCCKYHFAETRHQAAPTAIAALLVPSPPGPDEHISCIIRESGGDFFAVRLTDDTESLLPREYLAEKAKNAELTALISHTHLITLTRQRRTLHRNRCLIAAYPLHWNAPARSQAPDFEQEFQGLLAPDKEYRMQVISDESSPDIAILGLDGKIATVSLQVS